VRAPATGNYDPLATNERSNAKPFEARGRYLDQEHGANQKVAAY
jgi:hypothetical protein